MDSSYTFLLLNNQYEVNMIYGRGEGYASCIEIAPLVHLVHVKSTVLYTVWM